MSNCAWCNKYGAVKFQSFDNGKKQYSREKFCSKKCLAEYEQNNNTVKWYDAKYEDESSLKEVESNLKRIEESNNYRKEQEIKNTKLVYNYAATIPIFIGIVVLTNERHSDDYIAIIFIIIGVFYLYKRIRLK
jgi:hypothetical protein